MLNKSKLLLIAVLFVLASSGLVVIHGFKNRTISPLSTISQKPAQQIKPRCDDDDLPIVDSTTPITKDEKKAARRKAKGQKYSNPSFPLSERDANISHIEDGPMTALPVEESALIIVGEITKAEAMLSNDGTSVYSEFTVRVKEILKNDPTEPVAKGDLIIIERQGGRLRLPSGKLAVERLVGTKMPRLGKTYVLFITKPPDNTTNIYMGYEVSGEQVTPLDNCGNNPGVKYNGVLLSKLLSDISRTLSDQPINLTTPK